MKEITVTSAKAFEKKSAEIDQLFSDANKGNGFENVQDERFASLFWHKNAREYPNGALLMLKKKCPYCNQVQLYNERRWEYQARRPSMFPGPLPDPAIREQREAVEAEIKRLNPDICLECFDKVYEESVRST